MPKFVQIAVTNCQDAIDGRMISVCYGLDSDGQVWQQFGANRVWHRISLTDQD